MNALQEYFNYRQALIEQYLKGDMTKREYLAQNFQAVLNLKDKPLKMSILLIKDYLTISFIMLWQNKLNRNLRIIIIERL